jgi:hypothetical protein
LIKEQTGIFRHEFRHFHAIELVLQEQAGRGALLVALLGRSS